MVGQQARVLFRLNGLFPITHVEVDLIGDGRDADMFDFVDARRVAGLFFTPTRAGSYWLQVRVLDEAGCTDETSVRREIVVAK